MKILFGILIFLAGVYLGADVQEKLIKKKCRKEIKRVKPVDFKDKNLTLTAPGCGKLPALQTRDNCIVTCWEMSEEEQKLFKKTGKIWLSVIGLKHPPVCMSVEQPYAMHNDDDTKEK